MNEIFTTDRLPIHQIKLQEQNQMLLTLTEDLLKVKSREDLHKLFLEKLPRFLTFSNARIFLLSPDKNYFFDLLTESFRANTSFLSHEDLTRNSSANSLIAEFAKSVSDARLFEVKSLPSDIRHFLIGGASEKTSQMIAGSLGQFDREEGIILFFDQTAEPFDHLSTQLFHRFIPLINATVRNILDQERIEQNKIEKEIISSFGESVKKVKDRLDLVHIIRDKLAELVTFTDIAVTIYKPVNHTFQVFAHQVNDKMGGHPKFRKVIEPEYPVEDGIHEMALYADGPAIVAIEDALRSPNRHAGTQFIHDSGIRKMLLFKLVANSQIIGFLNILSSNPDAFAHVNNTILKGICTELASGMSSILLREEAFRKDQENEVLLSISAAVAANRSIEEIIEMIFSKLGSVIYFNDICISQYNLQKNTSKVLAYTGDLLNQDFGSLVAGDMPIQDDIHHALVNSGSTVCFSFEELKQMNMPYVDFLIQAGVRECACIRLTANQELIGSLTITSDRQNGFTDQDFNLIERLSHYLSAGLANIIARQQVDKQFEEIQKYKQMLEEENEYLQEEANEGYTYEDIVGAGPEMQEVFHLLSQVSFTNSTILLLGETGTGKEMVARAIHNASGRKDKLMVKVNCAALPPNLIESELFGHERGSFTGATERRVGKFELANRGTLFLDEIGELPLDLQSKLLRAIQEREIERVGGKMPIKIDIRIIAATNRNLLTEVNEGRFRSDLYYRLNVFPITLPPLRQRKEDIPSLSSHFINKFSKNTGKKITQISSNALKELTAYSWPGNVRELEHVLERCVLMARDKVIRHVHLPGTKSDQPDSISNQVYTKTHEENERDYIVAVLNSCGGKIYGIGGAAQVLNLKVGTLNSKIKKLGITREQVIFKKGR